MIQVLLFLRSQDNPEPRFFSALGVCVVLTPGGNARTAAMVFALVAAASGAHASGSEGGLSPLNRNGTIHEDWRVMLLPGQRLPATRFAIVERAGMTALELRAERSFGNLVHSFPPGASAGTLSWRWSVECFAKGSNLRKKSGDDNAVKVCALFDLPIGRIPFFDRHILKRARGQTGEPLPAATVCYVWDPSRAAGSPFPNPYSKRLRYIVLRSGHATESWSAESRDLAADFLAAFGEESRFGVPPLAAIAVGADSDNTKSSSLSWVTALTHAPIGSATRSPPSNR